MKQPFLILLLLTLCGLASAQSSPKYVIRVTTDITGASSCAAERIYYNATSGVNWERNAAGVCAKITAGGTPGNVVGPASSTDNAVTRFDSTTGKLIQNSLLTVDDSGSVNIPSGQTYKINNVALAKGDVGLGNVDNTSDVNKPVSTAQATADALNLKIASNLSDLNSPSTARTNLGGTTAGIGFFTFTNPSAIRFPRIEADNSVSGRTAAQLLADISALPLAGGAMTGPITIDTSTTNQNPLYFRFSSGNPAVSLGMEGNSGLPSIMNGAVQVAGSSDVQNYRESSQAVSRLLFRASSPSLKIQAAGGGTQGNPITWIDALNIESDGAITAPVSITTAGPLIQSVAGQILSIKSGSNQRAGNVTLVNGTVTVSNTTVTANTVIILNRKTASGTLGAGGYAYSVSAATSFTINSVDLAGVLSALDNSVISYLLIEVP